MVNNIKENIQNWVNDITKNTEVFLVEVRISEVNQKITIIVDADILLDVDKCADINRYVLEKLDELYPDNTYTIEVSSPGADKPLKLVRQYYKHIGRIIQVELNSGESHKGWLKEINNDGIILEDRKINLLSKKKVKPDIQINLSQIKESIVAISFK